MQAKTWIQAAGVRALRTAAQTAVALIGTGAVGVGDVDWLQVASVSVVAALLSLLTSVGGLPEVDPNDNQTIGRHLKGGANGAQ